MSAFESLRLYLVARRKELKRSQAEVGRLMGTTQSAVSDLENGRTQDPCMNTIARWAQALEAEVTLQVTETITRSFPLTVIGESEASR